MPTPNVTSAREMAGTFRLTRAHRVFLGLVDSVVGFDDAPTLSSLEVQFSRKVFLFLQPLLATGGAWRSGPLFGTRDSSALTVMFAAQAGYWTTPPQADEVFRLDSAYLLGWTDALGAALSQGLDWVGHWVMFPDGQYHPGEEEDVLTSKAETLGLTDRHHILALVGMIDGKANIQVYYPGVYDDLAEKSE